MARRLPVRKRPAHLPPVESGHRSVILFLTVCTHGRRPILATSAVHEGLRAAWVEADHYLVGRYMIMPDHIHLFCAPAAWPPPLLKPWARYWKSRFASKWPRPFEGKLWQRDFWDRQLRRGESYEAKWQYVVRNPVRAGLVEHPDDWPFQGELNRLPWHD